MISIARYYIIDSNLYTCCDQFLMKGVTFYECIGRGGVIRVAKQRFQPMLIAEIIDDGPDAETGQHSIDQFMGPAI